MSALRATWHIALADVRERMRRTSYLVTLGAAAWLGYGVAHGTIALRFGDYRGAASSAWIGLQMALATAGFVSLAGFWVVRGAVERDRTTRVGQVLAATPLGRLPYACGKLLSNFLVLGSIVAVLAAAALAMQLLARDAGAVAAWPLLSPFLLVALPAMAGTAAFALLFECVPFLAGGFGNVAWFFLWGGFGAAAAVGHAKAVDLIGFTVVEETVVPLVRARFPAYVSGFSLSAGPRREALGTFDFPGVDWTAPLVASRLSWFLAALAIAAAGALVFDRFDSARGAALGARDERDGERGGTAVPGPRPATLTRLEGTWSPRFGALVLAELRLMLKGRRWWWWAVFVGLLLAQAAAPLPAARHHALALAWIWPVLVWSEMGAREVRNDTEGLVFSAPRSLTRQLPALFAAGVVVAAAAGGVAGLRLLLAGDLRGLLAWAAGALFVPALALALGCASGSARLFEALYTVLWYVGPMQGRPIRELDFLGALPEHAAAAPVWGAAALALVAVAFSARARRMRG